MPVKDLLEESADGPVVEVVIVETLISSMTLSYRQTAAMLLSNPEIRSSGQSLEDIWKLAKEIVVAKRQSSDNHVTASTSSAPSSSRGTTTGLRDFARHEIMPMACCQIVVHKVGEERH